MPEFLFDPIFGKSGFAETLSYLLEFVRFYTIFFSFSEKSGTFSFQFRHFLPDLKMTIYASFFKALHLTFDLDFQLLIYL